MRYPAIFLFLIIVILGFGSCSNDKDQPYQLPIPEGFSKPAIREDSPITEARIKLGKRLFFEPILSRDSSISCGSCHHPSLAFSDNKSISPGVDGKLGRRNAPSLSNLAWYPYFFAEGGSPNLEAQILGPLEDPNEMDFSIIRVVERLKQNKFYVSEFEKVFGEEPSPYTISRAIASFERSLVSGNSPFDQYYYQKKEDALTDAAKRGFELFKSESLACNSCHSGFLFTDFSFQNIGLYQNYKDEGRARLTLNTKDSGKFKVPTLRNIEVTGPYMHDGSMQSLGEVIQHYMGGGFDHSNKDPRIKPILLMEAEKQDLIAFLKSLTDKEYIQQKI